MPDIVNAATRSRMMSGIRGRDTKPELAVRRFLHSRGLRFRVRSSLPGRPDIMLRKHRVVVFVNGCFWHRHGGCRFAYLPKSNQEFWKAKLDGNVLRDARDQHRLSELGWRVFVVWECEATDNDVLDRLAESIRSTI